MALARLAFDVAGFRRAKRGNFAIIFALMLMPVAAIAGLALDYARIRTTQSLLQSAVDAAALAAAGAIGRPDAQVQQLVADFVEANSGGRDVNVETRIDGDQLTVEASTLVPTPLLSVISNPQTLVSFKAVVVREKPKAGGSVSGPGVRQDPGPGAAEQEAARWNFLKALAKLPPGARARLERKYDAMLRLARSGRLAQ